MHISHPTT